MVVSSTIFLFMFKKFRKKKGRRKGKIAILFFNQTPNIFVMKRNFILTGTNNTLIVKLIQSKL